MRFVATELKDAWMVELDFHRDHRGGFARCFCAREFAERGLNPTVAQCNVSFNPRQGTLRGLHYQLPPAAESKLIRCTRGAVYDVIVDLRPDSPTYRQYFGVELSASNHRALYVPEMFAHAYQTMTDNTEVVYQVGEFYSPGHEKGIRYDDPAFAVEWPLPVNVISDKDSAWPLFADEAEAELRRCAS